MAFTHGIVFHELATALTPVISVGNLPIVIGTAPIHAATAPAAVNVPKLCFNMAEFRSYFGFSDDFDSYTLCEAANCFFSLFNVGPICCINVLNPATHKKSGSRSVSVIRGYAEFAAKIIPSSLVVKSGDKTLTKDSDYTAAYNAQGNFVLTILNKSKITANAVQLTYDETDASSVTKAQILEGIEQIGEVYPRTQIVPSMLLVPKWSGDSEVAAVMRAKVLDINTCFKCISVVDLPTDTVRTYDACAEYKSANGFVSEVEYLCWPEVTMGGKKYHLSTQAAAMMLRRDAQNGDVPYESPSNKTLQIDGACLADGTEVFLGKDQATYLNSVGVTTALNFAGAWRLWGNYLSVFPTSSDPINFLPVKRMMFWIGNSLVTNFLYKVDAPINKRLVQSIVNSIQIWLNSLVAREMLLGARIEFLDAENSLNDLMQGKLTFHIYAGFLVPAQSIDFLIEFDTNYFKELFAA